MAGSLNTKVEAILKPIDGMIDANTCNNNWERRYVNTTNKETVENYLNMVIATTIDETFAHIPRHSGSYMLDETDNWKQQVQTIEDATSSYLLRLFPLFSYDPRRYRYDAEDIPRELLMSKNHRLWVSPFARIVGGHNYRDTPPIENESRIWTGFTMNPQFGFRPFDERYTHLSEFYYTCENREIPILAHCAPHGVLACDADEYKLFDEMHSSESKRQEMSVIRHVNICKSGISEYRGTRHCSSNFAGKTSFASNGTSLDYFYKNYGHPYNWQAVLQYFPKLHLCLAGFGGNESWSSKSMKAWVSEYKKNMNYSDNLESRFAKLSIDGEWIYHIINLTDKYENVYTDISGLDIKNKDIRVALNLILRLAFENNKDYQHLRKKIIFGSGEHMTLALGSNNDKYNKRCEDFQTLFKEVERSIKDREKYAVWDGCIWDHVSLLNPWQCYSMSEQKFRDMYAVLRDVYIASSELNKIIDIDDMLCRKLPKYNQAFEDMAAELRNIRVTTEDDALMETAKIMLPRAKDSVEYGATICRKDNTFFISNVMLGTKDQVRLCDGVGIGVKTIAYIHTHGPNNQEMLSAADLYASFKRQTPIYLVTIDTTNKGKLLGYTPQNINLFKQPYNTGVSASNRRATYIDPSEHIESLYNKMNSSHLTKDNKAAVENMLYLYLDNNAEKRSEKIIPQ